MTGAYLKSIGFNKKVYLYGTRGIADELANFGIDSIGLGVSKSKFFSEGIFLYRGFSLLQSEHLLFLHFAGLFFKILFVKVEAF